MPEALLDHQDLKFVYKPSGIPTHSPSLDRQGFVEWWQAQSGEDSLYVCHRLDKDTSGVLVFAKNKEAARTLTETFSNREVKKEYFFISDKKSQFQHWSVGEREGQAPLVKEGLWATEGLMGFEAFTEFSRIDSQNSLYLYQAKPLTGKTHQIRKHAVKSQIPILGDDEYGGSPFPRLMLHAHTISFQWNKEEIHCEAPVPDLFKQLHKLTDTQWCRWLTSFERRKVLFPELIANEQCLRLFHQETGDLRGDQVGHRLVLGWWQKEPPNNDEKVKIEKLCDYLGYKNWVFEWRPGVEQKQNTEILIQKDFKDQHWEFSERNRVHKANMDHGQNFGLFLDQRDRRDWVQGNSQGKKVLNLFAYTCGFSLAAALGKASEVVSVDLSKKYLEWGRENFQLNNLKDDDPKYRWVAMDSQDYLTWCGKKEKKFDLIICDPPSFSRHKKSKKTFKVDKDFESLIGSCFKQLNPKGVLMFSTNFEKWSLVDWVIKLEASSLPLKEIHWSDSQWDFEWQSKEAGLKAFFLRKA